MANVTINMVQWLTFILSVITIIICYLRFKRDIYQRWIIFVVVLLMVHTIIFYLCQFYVVYIDTSLPHSFTEWSSYLRVQAAFTFLCLETYKYLKGKI